MKLENLPELQKYDQNLPLKLKCEATYCGLSATLLHVFESGEERAIAYTSRLLKFHETRYSPIEVESVSIVFAVVKFRQYVANRKFTLCTTDQALNNIFRRHNKQISAADKSRLDKWASILSRLDYDIDYRVPSTEAVLTGVETDIQTMDRRRH